jgi:hypothetical protein
MIPCEIRKTFEDQVNAAYKELAEAKYDSPESGRKAQAKISSLLKQKHAHERKHGCLRDSN